jgi:RNA polymerase sigma factor (sigma-70 family)
MDNTYSHSRAPAQLVRRLYVSGKTGARRDAELIAASVRDPDAFTELFARHWDAVYRFCVHRAGAAGEDIAAETFRVAFDRRRRYDSRYSDARPWFFGIATNLLRDHFRTASREESRLERLVALDSPSNAASDLNDLERHLLGPDVAAALEGIPAPDRDALLLLAWADLDYEQIAQALDIRLGTVGSRINRARQRVRDYLSASEDHQDRAKEA